MSSFDLNREIPFYPKRRQTTLSRFSTLIAIETTQKGPIAKWVDDPALKNKMARGVELAPEREEREWLSDFLNLLRDRDRSPEERERARQHILCFYQETCFWTVKKLWRKVKCLYPIATWQEVFELAGEDFETLDGAIAALKTFDPARSTKNYIKTMVYRKIKHWLKKKLGPDSRIELISFEEQIRDGETSGLSLSQQQAIQQKTVEEQEQQEALSERKIKRDRILEIVESELHKIEQTFLTENTPKIGKSPISLWAVLILSYGFNLMQSGASKLLAANNMIVDQTTLSRHLQKFKITLFVKCISEFSNELKNVFEEEKKSDGTLPFEQSKGVRELAKENHKLLDDLLDDSCQNWLLEKVLRPVEREICHPFEESIILILSHWLQHYFQLILELTCLSKAQRQKFNKVVSLWIQQFELS